MRRAHDCAPARPPPLHVWPAVHAVRHQLPRGGAGGGRLPRRGGEGGAAAEGGEGEAEEGGGHRSIDALQDCIVPRFLASDSFPFYQCPLTFSRWFA